MHRKIMTGMLTLMLAMSSLLSANLQYEIHDIDTLQTHSSEAIALNNNGDILGVYNLDGSQNGECVFFRDKEGGFSELPSTVDGICVNWRYLTNNSTVYGTFESGGFTTLFMWDSEGGAVNLGNLPGKEISAINDAGQVLVKCVSENVDGKSISYPVIWKNGGIIKLEGLVGDGGIPSDEAVGLDMNNHGDVVGHSVIDLIYKNKLYKQTRATKWVNGKVIDLHKSVPKSAYTVAKLINDYGEVIVGPYLVDKDGDMQRTFNSPTSKTDTTYFYNNREVFDKNHKTVTSVGHVGNMMLENRDSIWLRATKIVGVNDNGEIIAQGQTIFGEQHALFLSPIDAE